MFRLFSILFFGCSCFSIQSQSLSGPETVKHYTPAQKKLLIFSTAKFIDLITQSSLDGDSVVLMACKITGLPFLAAYGNDKQASSISDNLINAGKISQAIHLLDNVVGNNRLAMLTSLATWYLHKPGRHPADLDSANLFIQQALALTAATNKNQVRALRGEYYRQRGDFSKSKTVFLQMVSSSPEGDNETKASALHHLAKLENQYDSSHMMFLNKSLTMYRNLKMKEKEIELLFEVADYHLKYTNISPPEDLFKNDLLAMVKLQHSIDFKHTLFVEYLLAYVENIGNNYLSSLDHAKAAYENMKWSGMSALQGSFCMRVGTAYAAFEKKRGGAFLVQKRSRA